MTISSSHLQIMSQIIMISIDLLTYDNFVIQNAINKNTNSIFSFTFIFVDFASMCHIAKQTKIRAKFLRTMTIICDRLSQVQYNIERLFYINVFLIQLASYNRIIECTICAFARTRELKSHSFFDCRRFREFFEKCCDNCKFSNHDFRCT